MNNMHIGHVSKKVGCWCLGGGLRRWQSRVLLILRVAAVLVVSLLVTAFSTQLIKALTTVTLMGRKEVPQIQTAHCFAWTQNKRKREKIIICH